MNFKKVKCLLFGPYQLFQPGPEYFMKHGNQALNTDRSMISRNR